jgi:hypothetical protein
MENYFRTVRHSSQLSIYDWVVGMSGETTAPDPEAGQTYGTEERSVSPNNLRKPASRIFERHRGGEFDCPIGNQAHQFRSR